MPAYCYECQECGHQEDHICRISERPLALPCPVRFCVGVMKQIITPVTIRCSDAVNVPWIRRAMNYLEPGHEDQYDTREKYNQYLEDHNLQPADGVNLSEV